LYETDQAAVGPESVGFTGPPQLLPRQLATGQTGPDQVLPKQVPTNPTEQDQVQPSPIDCFYVVRDEVTFYLMISVNIIYLIIHHCIAIT